MTARVEMTALEEQLARRGLQGDEAARALRSTLCVIGERLVDDEARSLADALPKPLGKLVEDADYDSDFGSDELFARIGRRMKVAMGRAIEDAEVVLVALGECLDPERRTRLARALPETAADLLLGKREPDPSQSPPSHRAARSPDAHVDTLASGRPGSRHPLGEGRPQSGHRHSVANAGNAAHEETKLSSARGTTQERNHETLAEGRPPAPSRSVGDASD